MASAAVLPTPVDVTPHRTAPFAGDSDDMLDRLVSACKEKLLRPANPSLYGRSLVKWAPENEMVCNHAAQLNKHAIARRPSFSKSEVTKRQKAASPSTTPAPRPQPVVKQPAAHGSPVKLSNKPSTSSVMQVLVSPAVDAAGAAAVNKSVGPFAGPGLCMAPAANAIPMPPASLLPMRKVVMA